VCQPLVARKPTISKTLGISALGWPCWTVCGVANPPYKRDATPCDELSESCRTRAARVRGSPTPSATTTLPRRRRDSPSIHPMGTLRRVTALLMALLLLQLTLADTNAACLTHVQGAGGLAGDHSEMSITTLSGSADTNHPAVESSAKSTEFGVSVKWEGPTPEGSGCPTHDTTPACDSGAGCAHVVLNPTVTSVSIVAVPMTSVAVSHIVAPRTRTTAPELPPPRV
jgi:hypothetical protein